jgi:hypothetical protein
VKSFCGEDIEIAKFDKQLGHSLSLAYKKALNSGYLNDLNPLGSTNWSPHSLPSSARSWYYGTEANSSSKIMIFLQGNAITAIN